MKGVNMKKHSQKTLAQMGWNDVMGNLSRVYHEDDTLVTNKQRRDWARRILKGKVLTILPDISYHNGMKEAAKAFLAGKRRTFRGPKYVRKHLRKHLQQWGRKRRNRE